MLDDDYDETLEEKDDLKKIDSPLKVAGDDFGDAEDDS
jgi:hypothetical protein